MTISTHFDRFGALKALERLGHYLHVTSGKLQVGHFGSGMVAVDKILIKGLWKNVVVSKNIFVMRKNDCEEDQVIDAETLLAPFSLSSK